MNKAGIYFCIFMAFFIVFAAWRIGEVETESKYPTKEEELKWDRAA